MVIFEKLGRGGIMKVQKLYSRYKKFILTTATVVVLLLFIGAPTVGWVAASQVLAVQRQIVLYDQIVLEVNGDNYKIKGSAYDVNGVIGAIRTDGSFAGQFGPPSNLNKEQKTSERKLVLTNGTLPKLNDKLSLQGNIWTSDPKEALGIDYQDVKYPTEVGDMSAWRINGQKNDRWTIGVHGIGADKNEMLRFVKPVLATGDTMLIINYRNDANNPSSPDNRNNLGATEWRDLESAVTYARDNGARSVRLYGGSLGGSIVMNFLKRTSDQNRSMIQKVVLDSPALNWGSILRSKATQGGYPEQIYYPTALLLQLRAGIDLDDISAKPQDFTKKTLIIHAANDKTVPQLGSRQAAEGNPANVQLVDFGDGGHLRSWNYDAPRYEKLVTDFLAG